MCINITRWSTSTTAVRDMMFYPREGENIIKRLLQTRIKKKKHNFISLQHMYTVGGYNNVYMCTYTSRRSTMMIVRVLYIPIYVYSYFLSDFFFFTSPTLVPLIDDRSCTTIRIYIFSNISTFILYTL